MGVKRFKLYHYPATRSARVKWLLHELLGDDFDVEVVPLYEGAQHEAKYLELNPNHNVPTLEMLMDDGERVVMLESGAMVTMLADAFPEKGLAPPPLPLGPARARYLQMVHFGGSWMDMMLWQIRVHTHLLPPAARDERTVERYRKKFKAEVEPQLIERLRPGGYICGEAFTAADCLMGQTVLWAKAYGLCQNEVFSGYVSRFTKRPAFTAAYADLGDFTLEAPPERQARFNG
ncbi:MAG: glutathione S-transferase family protein [Myxococcales bacterium]|nr:glutathione S-transferase family protein [Myxococcales bacterium]